MAQYLEMPELLLSFYGDDFTGSTDAMESLARGGVRTALFTNLPTRAQLAKYPGLRAFGVAGMTRSMPPDEMEQALRPAFRSLREIGAPIAHYKVCSTFDSSPNIGSIGRVIDIGMDVFGAKFVPIVVGAPALGRYCVFGNLFARSGTESEPYRLDRHPSMSRHPTTPMDEADLRLHLAKQTSRKIGLLDVTELQCPDLQDRFADFRTRYDAGILDLLDERQLPVIGSLLDDCPRPLFVVGSSGVESALSAHWKFKAIPFPPVSPAEAILVLCGSCSPVTCRQVADAEARGFASFSFDQPGAHPAAVDAIRNGRSAIVHTFRAEKSPGMNLRLSELAAGILGAANPRRMAVAGGDTSGAVAGALGIESLEMVGELTRGSPLCRASAPGSPADGIEITFKGGQIGPVDFFERVRTGTSDG